MIACPSESQWVEWNARRVVGGAEDSFEEHRAACASCAAFVARLTTAPLPDPAELMNWAAPIASAPLPDAADLLNRPEPIDSSPAREARRPQIKGYEILEEIGRGGFGTVYRARADALPALELALKVLHSTHVGPTSLERFQREAGVLARVRDDNVVRVHTFGVIEGGGAYIGMEYVDGGTLEQRWSRARADRTGPLPADVAFLVETLARTMGRLHAGQDSLDNQAIVHRDLKPSNVLMTRDGVPKITDFGFALKMDLQQGGASFGAGPSGGIEGTPAFMSPEQARGNRAGQGPLTDVYSLGAILYYGLTGRSPFVGANFLEVLGQLEDPDREPIATSHLNPLVPHDLEVICQTCLRKAPEKRYRGAVALADDLRRFLDGKPIEARPAGRLERSWKWCRRYPWVAAAVAALSLLLAATTVSTIVAVVQAGRASEEARHARAEEWRANQTAQIALDGADATANTIANDPGLKRANFTATRKRLLQSASKTQQNLAEIQGESASARAQRARALLSKGVLHEELVEPNEALACFDEAVRLLADLTDEFPDVPRYRKQLADAYNGQGRFHARFRGDVKTGEPLFEKALEQYDGLVRDHPDDLGYAFDRTQVWLNLGNCRLHAVDADAALKWYVKCRLALRPLVGRHPNQAAVRDRLANVLDNEGMLRLERKKEAEEAAKLHREALGYRKLQLEQPDGDGPENRQQLASTYNHLGNVLRIQGNLAEAMDAYKASLGLLEKLAAELPEVRSVEHELTFALLNVGQTFGELDRPGEALEFLDKGIARLRVIEKVSKEYADTLKEALAIRAAVAEKKNKKK